MKVLVLCTGNSCRSQMAHGFLQSFDKNLQVYSAGTQPTSQVHPLAVDVMKEVGIDISFHTPRNVGIYLNEVWDYVITVCGNANDVCPMFIGQVGKRLHIGFDDPSGACGSEEFVAHEFRRVRDEIEKRMAEFYDSEILKREIPNCTCAGKF